jgi:molybdate/tungstate transport system substrate-binding protein
MIGSRRTLVLLVLTAALIMGALGGGTAGAATGNVFIANAGVLGSMVTGLKTLIPAADPGLTVSNQTGGSVALAQSIEGGTLMPDIFGSADANVHKLLVGDANGNKETWFAAFARNAIVLQYSTSPNSPLSTGFAQVAAGNEPWYQPFVDAAGPIRLCRMSPDADPSGYYTLFVMQLAEQLYNIPGLKTKVLGDDRNPAQMTPACSAGGKSLTNGGLDVSFTYLSGAVGGTTPYIVLPDQVNLGNPDDADFYANASFTNSAGQTFHGGVIRPSIAPVQVGAPNADGGEAVLKYIFQNQSSLLSTYHFLSSEIYAGGDPTAIPAELRPYFNLRRMQVTAKTGGDGCSTDRMAVSGDGVTISGADRHGAMCTVTLDVAAGAVGVRDLMEMNKPFPGKGNANGRKAVDQTWSGAVDLTNAIPVVPDFLQ